jgi:membrane protein YdbS with pleckstrin-like domain
VIQVILALAATIAGISAWFMGAPRLWFVGAVLIFAVIPFTLIVIMPTDKKLLDPGLNRSSEVAHQLLQDWGKLHAVRRAVPTEGPL